ncbi:hypothetical protein BDU57DRAFT_443578 [Ampelomyces quisqualis]|uniref:Uncharacterized protein n=1 Tax=Ampelomyces quisqualis TaxID=50730 RepID=A0A6A5QXZ2_AMPQU|nr:hypothetical protein BDU57DRAFT_443578 [Ampelomyces quisqualis]
MPAITLHDYASEIHASVRQLKIERDTWQAVASKYKSAFDSQTSRLHELQDVCFAAQAELENERAQRRRLQTASERTTCLNVMDGAEKSKPAQNFGMATVFPQRQTSDMCTNPLFHGVQRCIDERNYGTAIVELERLLRGPLSPKARAEGLLLKSSVLRAAGPEELLDALAACSEALELCDRLSDLETFLPRVQYQRGVLFYQLRMLHQARDAFSAVNNDDFLSATANEYRSSCDEEIRLHNASNRRSGFDENRFFDEGLLVQLDEKLDTKCRRTSAQLSLRAAVKSKRMSIPHRWTSGKSDVS